MFFLYENNRQILKKYKKTKNAYIAAQWFPIATVNRFKPICRLMLWALYNDDLYEESEPENIKSARDQSIAILNGELNLAEFGALYEHGTERMEEYICQTNTL